MSAAGHGRLAGKVAIVTGASQGIGRAIALAFVREGADVVAAARNEAKLAETVELAGGKALACRCDVSDARDVRRLVETAVTELGALHVLVNNAGVLHSCLIEEMSEEQWDETFAVNVKGVFLACKYAMPEIVSAGGGAVVNIASVNSFVGERLHSAYVASKGAVQMFTKNIAEEYAARGVRVNAICPGAVDTPMEDAHFDALGGASSQEHWIAPYQPLVGGMIAPEGIADVAVFLASDDARSMTGSSVVVDAGLTATWDHALGT